jgi:cytochrome c553
VKYLICLLLAGMAAAAQARPAFEDSMAQRTLACTGCHGKQGRAGPDGYYPRIAGKPAGYLYNQLLNFRDGRRRYGLMTRLLDPLSDEYLLEIARHFAGLDLPHPAPLAARVDAAVLRRGEALARQGDAARDIPACTQCHGAALTGVEPGTPGLLGLPRDYLNAQLGAWRTGQREAHAPDCMAEIARRLQPEDVLAVAAWLSSRPLPMDTRPAASLRDAPSMPCGSAPLPRGPSG